MALMEEPSRNVACVRCGHDESATIYEIVGCLGGAVRTLALGVAFHLGISLRRQKSPLPAVDRA